MQLDKDTKKIKSILNSSYTFPILSKIYYQYRPSQIAKQLGVSAQCLNYHTTRLMNLQLIARLGDRRGIAWKLTEVGLFSLKQFLRRSVNYGNGNNSRLYSDTRIPLRLHQVTFAFKINSSLEELKIEWKIMKNGVSKYTVRDKNKGGHTAEIVKSPNDGKSVMLVHPHQVHTLNVFKEIIKLYELARTIAVLTGDKLGIDICKNGELVKKPHLAFDYDLIALYLATFETADITTVRKKGRAWIDASQGFGELETNDIDYAFKYLTMPENTFKIYEDTSIIKRKLLGYEKFYHPALTDNS